MAWEPIREATERDQAKLDLRAAQFAKRHNLQVEDWSEGQEGPTASDVEWELAWMVEHPGTVDYDQGLYLRSLWRRVVQRALGYGAEGIAYGYVGRSGE